MKRLKIYSVVLILVLIAYSLPSMLSYVVQGFEAGFQSADQHYANINFVALQPVCGGLYSNVAIAKIDSTSLPIAVSNATIAIPESVIDTLQNSESYSLYRISNIVMQVMAFPILIGIVCVFVMVIQVLLSVLRTKVFDYKTIKHINRVGWTLLCLELIAGASNLLSFVAMSKVIDFGLYQITYWEALDIANIIIAIIILLMNELLHIATGLKEEQDLTI